MGARLMTSGPDWQPVRGDAGRLPCGRGQPEPVNQTAEVPPPTVTKLQLSALRVRHRSAALILGSKPVAAATAFPYSLGSLSVGTLRQAEASCSASAGLH